MLCRIMPDTVERLHTRAQECERKAAMTKDEVQRRTFLELARAWREMATDYEGLTRKAAENKKP